MQHPTLQGVLLLLAHQYLRLTQTAGQAARRSLEMLAGVAPLELEVSLGVDRANIPANFGH